VLAPPVLPLDQPVPLLLEFDELGNAFKNYRAKIFTATPTGRCRNSTTWTS
jgi:hypothetical protein